MGELPLGVIRRGKIDLCADLEDVRLDLNHLKIGSGSRLFFLKEYWVVSGFLYGPLRLQVSKPLGRVEDGVG